MPPTNSPPTSAADRLRAAASFNILKDAACNVILQRGRTQCGSLWTPRLAVTFRNGARESSLQSIIHRADRMNQKREQVTRIKRLPTQGQSKHQCLQRRALGGTDGKAEHRFVKRSQRSIEMGTFALRDQRGGLILGTAALEKLCRQLRQGDLRIRVYEGDGAVVVEFDLTVFAGLN